MKKTEYANKMNAYNEYAKTVNPRVIPTKGVSTGTYGRDYESRVKYIINNYRCLMVSEKSGVDTTKKIDGKFLKFEIKNRCSTIGTYKNGVDIFPLLKSDFVIYTMNYLPEMNDNDISENSFVIPSNDFLNMLYELKLVRNNTARLEYQIQVFYTSKKRTNAFYTALSEYPTLSEFFNI